MTIEHLETFLERFSTHNLGDWQDRQELAESLHEALHVGINCFESAIDTVEHTEDVAGILRDTRSALINALLTFDQAVKDAEEKQDSQPPGTSQPRTSQPRGCRHCSPPCYRSEKGID